MATPPPASGVITKTVERAVNALLNWRDTKTETRKPQLLEHDEFFYLILTMKKIPQNDTARINPYKIPLPHPILDPKTDGCELCLIIDDRPKSGLTKDAAAKKVEEDGIAVSKIIKLSKLKTDYRPFEAKRKLCDSYDMFLADKRVIPLLPQMLGKQFFKRKKIPVSIDLKHRNWKEQIERACGSGLLFFRTGTCSVVKVGRVSMGKEAIVANIVAAINGIVDVVPRKWGGVRSFHVKLLESLALPLYQTMPDLKLRIEGAKEAEEAEEEKKEAKEIVKVKKSSEKKRKKGRIHEVKYIDTDDDEINAGDEFGTIGEDGDDLDGGEDLDDLDTATAKLDGKKREKADRVEGAKRVKKVKEVVGVKPDERELKSEDGVKLKKRKGGLKNGEVPMKEKKKTRTKVLAAL